MVIDCFLFFNELEMLKLRLEELKDVVDVFVLSESRYTFSGKEKPLVFQQNAHEFKEYNIVHLVAEELRDSDPWANEASQRNLPMEYLNYSFGSSDIVLLCDLDEIPKANVVKAAKDGEFNLPVVLEMDFYYYNLNWMKKSKWCRSSVIKKELLNKHSIEDIRSYKANIQHRIPDAGWHLSYFMTPEQIQDKIKSFSHQEYNNDNYLNLDGIRRAIATGKDLFWRGDSEDLVRAENMSLPDKVECLPKIFWPTTP